MTQNDNAKCTEAATGAVRPESYQGCPGWRCTLIPVSGMPSHTGLIQDAPCAPSGSPGASGSSAALIGLFSGRLGVTMAVTRTATVAAMPGRAMYQRV